MAESAHLLPHLERLLRRVEEAETPLVQIWGWPGSGKAGLLQAFLERQGPWAAPLPLAVLAGGEEAFQTWRGKAEAARFLVVAGDPGGGLAQVAQWLVPGQRLIFASDRRWGQPELPSTLVSPQEMLLTAAEIASLWYLLTGSDLAPEEAQGLLAASDGWWRPLRLAIEATGGMGLEGATAERFLELQPVRLFLRHEILDALTATERAHLLTASTERPTKRGDDWRWIDSRGLWVEGEERDHLPRLLGAAVERERRRRRPPTVPRAILAPPAPPPAGRPRFTLSLLGDPLVRRHGQAGDRDLDCRLKRSLQVLAFLASTPELSAGRGEVIEAVWPEEGEQTIERNFHPTLSYLRRALEARDGSPSPLLFRGGVYRLSPEYEWQIDVHDFTRLAEEGKALADRGDSAAAVDTLQAAWKFYRGPFLQGHYEGWVTVRREVYQRLYLELLRDLGDLCIRLERSGEAMDAYRSALLEDPLQERIHLAVMRLYADQGRRDLVRRQYERLCGLLQEELGVEPLPQTVREYHRLMA